jgi:hypothetical protein
MNFDINIIGDDRGVQAVLGHLDSALSPSGIAAFLGGTVQPYIKQRAEGRFRGEGDDVVGNWIPLASATQHIRASQGYGPAHPINRRTGELEDYITGSPSQISIHALGATLTHPGKKPMGELKDKVETAQMGRQSPRTPSRPVLGMNMQDMGFVLSALAIYIRSGVPQ